jgi:hypothetical protein
MSNTQQYLQLLTALQSSLTATRQAAEASFDQLRENQPDDAVSLTVNIICTPTFPLDQRVFACVLFRRMVKPGACFTKITAQKQIQARQSILNLLVGDENTAPKTLRRSVVHSVASLAFTCDAKINNLNESWPELLQTVSGLAGTNNTQTYHRESGHELLRRLIEAKPGALLVHKNIIQSVMNTGLSDTSEHVRLAALQGCSEFLTLLETEEDRSLFLPLVPSLMNTLSGLLSGGDELNARDALESLVSVAEAQPTFWRTHLPLVWNAMCAISGHQKLESETRTMALELILVICEQAGGMVRKHTNLIQQFVHVVMSILCQVEDVDVQEWSTFEENEATYGDSMDEDEISNVAEQSMDRLATSLGGKIMTPILLPLVMQYLNDKNDWKKRRAGLETLALCAAGCGKSFENILSDLVTASIQYSRDDHVRVRYSSLHCLGQLAQDFQPHMQRKYQNTVLPVLGASLTSLNEGCERLQRLAVSALTNMCNEHCDKTTFSNYSKPLLEGLFALLSHSGLKTQAEVFAAVSAIASVIGKQFSPYYNIFMPLALNVLTQQQQATTSKDVSSIKMLRGRAMECTGIIACAVGKEQFMNHASSVMDILMNAFESNLSEDDPVKEFILPTLCAVCMCIEGDFVPYMKRIMPKLIQAATYSEDGVIIVADEEEYERGQLNVGDQYQMTRLNIPGQGVSFVGVNTLALQEKRNAVDILLQFVYALGDHYGPFVSDTVLALLPSVQKGIIPQMRSAAAAAMQGLVSTGIKCCVTQHKENYGESSVPTSTSMKPAQDLFLTVVSALVNQLGVENHDEVRGFIGQSLSECLQMARESGGHAIGKSSNTYNSPLVGIPQDAIVPLIVKLSNFLTEGVNRQMSAHQAVRDDPDCDEGMIEQLMDEMEEEAGYTTSILDSIGWIIKTYGASFFPIFNEHLSNLCKSLCASELGHVRAAGICMLDDVLEHCGETTAPVIVPDLLMAASQGIGAEEPMVRQACLYGFGLCAKFGGTSFNNQIAQQCLPQLIQYVDYWKRDDIRNKALLNNNNVDAPTDCGVSAVGSILAHRPETANSEFWSKWLSWLPLDSAHGDRLEAMDVHKLLLEQIIKNNVLLLGNSNENLPKVLTVLARAARGIPLKNVLDSVNYDEGDDVALMHPSDLIQLGTIFQNIVKSNAGVQLVSALSQEDQQTLNGLKK